MILINEIKGYMARDGITQKELAEMLGISIRTLSYRFENKNFEADEMYKMIKIFKIENPSAIFFADEVMR